MEFEAQRESPTGDRVARADNGNLPGSVRWSPAYGVVPKNSRDRSGNR
ncbi:hypothetical protein BN903_60 [Halorubrum sp. AJ67]|nr:hypothetical protein BN903_60 [Halorubrum sp. AJ67]